jgi:hypothetical protein
MQDGINELGSNPGDTIESLIQRLTLIITNPLCVDWIPGSGGGGGGGGIIQVGLVAPSNLFETPIVPVTTPGGDLTLTLNDQASNTVFAGPASGPDSTPQFRALVVDDLPALTTGDCVLRGDGAGKFACVTIGPNLLYSGGVLDANVNVVIGAENGLTVDPLNTDTVQLGGPSLAPGVLDFDTFIDTTNQFRLNLYGDNPTVKRGVLEVEHTLNEVAIKAIADTGTAISANIINGVTAVYASSTGSGIGVTAESDSGTAIAYTSTTKAGIIGDSADENIFTVNSTTPPNDSIVTSVLRLTKNYNSSSAIGIGSRLDFGFYNSTAVDKTSSTIESVTTNVTNTTETADLRFSTIGNGTVEIVGQFIGGTGVLNGQFRLNKYGINTFSAGTPLYGLAVDVQGKVMEVPLATGLGTVDNGLSLNPSLASEVWLGGTLLNPTGTVITVPDTFDFTITGTTTATNKSVLEINNTAGASATRALTVSSGGVSPAIYVSQSSSSAASCIFSKNSSTVGTAYGIISEANITPLYGRTTQAANTTQIELLKLHNRSTGSGGNGIGGYISLTAATAANSDQEAARIGYQFTDAATSTRKGQLEFYTANGAAPAQRMTIKETGQVQFNNYTTATSFTTVLGASLLGVDTSGNVVNSTGAEGLSFSGSTGNVELGRSTLAGTSDFSVDRFINSGTQQLTLSGTNVVAATSGTALQDAAILRVLNTDSSTDSTVGVYAQIQSSNNTVTNVTGAAAVMGVITGTGQDVAAVYGLNNSTDAASVAIRGQSTTGNAARFTSIGATTLLASCSGTAGLNGTTSIRAENTGTGDLTKVIHSIVLSRQPGSSVVGLGGGSAITYEMNAAGVTPGTIERPDLITLTGYAIDLTVNALFKTGFKIEVTHDTATPTERINFYGADIIKLTQNIPGPYANDVAANGAGVPQYALYRDASSNVKICQI